MSKQKTSIKRPATKPAIKTGEPANTNARSGQDGTAPAATGLLEKLTPKAAMLAIRHFVTLNGSHGWNRSNDALAYALALANAAERRAARSGPWELVRLLESYMVEQGMAHAAAQKSIAILRRGGPEADQEARAVDDLYFEPSMLAVAKIAARIGREDDVESVASLIAHAANELVECLSDDGGYARIENLIERLENVPTLGSAGSVEVASHG